MKSSTSIFHTIRDQRYHVRRWGPPIAAGDTPLVFLHGWMDVSASFQFVIDALPGDPPCCAPDWRGFGLSDWNRSDCYWFPDYLADLDLLLDALLAHGAPGQQVTLIGHSMGGNIALMYAGIRPQRVRAVVNLEGFGLRASRPDEAPARYARWFDQIKAGNRLREYDTLDEVAARLRASNPRLPPERAQFLAAHWSQPTAGGRLRIAGDPSHKLVNPVLYRWEEVAACWAQITSPVLWVQGAQTDAPKWAGNQNEIDRRRATLRAVRSATVVDAGHMLHQEQPAAVADLIANFLADIDPRVPPG